MIICIELPPTSKILGGEGTYYSQKVGRESVELGIHRDRRVLSSLLIAERGNSFHWQPGWSLKRFPGHPTAVLSDRYHHMGNTQHDGALRKGTKMVSSMASTRLQQKATYNFAWFEYDIQFRMELAMSDDRVWTRQNLWQYVTGQHALNVAEVDIPQSPRERKVTSRPGWGQCGSRLPMKKPKKGACKVYNTVAGGCSYRRVHICPWLCYYKRSRFYVRPSHCSHPRAWPSTEWLLRWVSWVS